MRRPRLSLSSQVLVGLGLGLAAGLFFGELVGFLESIGRAFILLLQMTVLPYVVASLVSGLGRLSYAGAGRLALRGGGVLLLLWTLGLGLVLIFPWTLPNWESASFFSTTLVEEPVVFDFLDLYIPSNPFRSLAQTIVPAIVVFSVATGVAMIGLENKQVLLEPIDAFAETMMRITQAVARLAPYGVFAITASAAGTLDLAEFTRLNVYVISHAVMTLPLSLWLLPGLVTTFTPLRYRELLGPTRDALVTAFATGNLLIVLPLLAQESKALLRRADVERREADSAIDVLVPASFNFPNLGKLSSLAFVPFSAWFAGTDLPGASYPMLLLTGLVTFFGDVIVALPFILDLMELPADLFQIFVTVDVVASRFGTLLAAMHVLVLTVLGTCAMTGHLELRWRAVGRYLVVSGVLVLAMAAGVRHLFGSAIEHEYEKGSVMANMQMITEPYPATVHVEPPPAPRASPEPAAQREAKRSLWRLLISPSPKEPGSPPPVARVGLDRVRAQRELRVGYEPGNMPFSYLNASGDLVGLDVEMAHELARELGAELSFVPIDPTKLTGLLDSGYCDLVMSAVAITPMRARDVAFSEPYLEETMALLVRDHLRSEFGSSEALRERRSLRIGTTGEVPYYVAKLRSLLPDAEIVELDSTEDFFAADAPPLDALLTTAERGSAWSLIHPEYTVAIPRPGSVRVPIAYAARQEDRDMLPFLDAWLELKRADGTISRLYDHWVLGKGAQPREPRWSVIRNVLGWVGPPRAGTPASRPDEAPLSEAPPEPSGPAATE